MKSKLPKQPITSPELLESKELEEYKEPGGKLILSKIEYDLYHEELDVQHPIIRVKRTCVTGHEKWRVFSNSTVLRLIDGNKLLRYEKEFLRSPEGVSFLIREHKVKVDEMKSFHGLRKAIRQILTSKKS